MNEISNRIPTDREKFDEKARMFFDASARNQSVPIQELYMMGNLLVKLAPDAQQRAVDGQCQIIYETYTRQPERAVQAMTGLIQESRDREVKMQGIEELKLKILGAERADTVTLDELKQMGEFLISQKHAQEKQDKLQSKLDDIYRLFMTDFAEALNQMGELIRGSEGRVQSKNTDPGRLANWLDAFRGKRGNN